MIGASERVGSVGGALMQNLSRFAGEVFPVNPNRSVIASRHAYPKITSLPAVPDLAVIAIPALQVPEAIQECAEMGVSAAVVLSAGFGECGAEGRELQRSMLKAAAGKVRIIGPNCLGVMIPSVGLNASFADSMAKPGNVAFLSQSGAMCTAVLDWSLQDNVGFSAFVSVGGMADVGWAELIEYFGDDPKTEAMVCYMESMGDARRFLSAAREVTFSKPVVVLKVGRTSDGARAAASHTGAMTGADDVFTAACERAGILRVATTGELFGMAELLAKQPRARGGNLAIITNGGGPGALAADQLLLAGGSLAPLGRNKLAALDAMLPQTWSHGNPVDLLGTAAGQDYGRAARVLLDDPEVHGLLAILTPQQMTDPLDAAECLVEATKGFGKPILASWMGGARVAAGRQQLNRSHVATFDHPDTAAEAFALMWQHSRRLQLLYERPSLFTEVNGERERVDAVLAEAQKEGRTLLSECEANEILGAYGIPVLKTKKATSEERAVEIAEELGYPVALKLWSDTLTHKARAGGVRLNLGDAPAVRRAWNEIRESAGRAGGAAAFRGAVVQPMFETKGVELILGSYADPQFGPVILFGAGGSMVEVYQDRALGIPPFNATLARQLMENTRVVSALRGKAERERLGEIIVRFSHLVCEQQSIAEIEINPLVASSVGLVALDARASLHPSERMRRGLPKLAIRPYPSRYCRELDLPEFGIVCIRPIRPDDEERLIAFHRGLSEQTVAQRYFGSISFGARSAHMRLAKICFADYDREITLIAERGCDGGTEIIGVARLTKVHGTSEAEFGLTITDAWQRRGLGFQMLQLLMNVAGDENVSRLRAVIRANNQAMIHLCRKIGFAIHPSKGEAEVAAVFDF